MQFRISKYFVSALIFLISLNVARSQNSKMDSLQITFKACGNDSNKVNIWIEISEVFRKKVELDQSIQALTSADSLAIKLNWLLGQAKAQSS